MLRDWGSYAIRVPMFLIPGYGYGKFLDWKAKGHKYPSKTGFTMCTALFWGAVAFEALDYAGII